MVLLTGVAACGTADVYNGGGSAQSVTTTGGTTGTVTGGGSTTGTATGTTAGTTGGDQNSTTLDPSSIPTNAFYSKSGSSITLVLSSRADFCDVLKNQDNKTVPGNSVEITLVGTSVGGGNVIVASASEDVYDQNCNDTADSLQPATLNYQSAGSQSIDGNVTVTFANGSNPNAVFQASACSAMVNNALQNLLSHGQCNNDASGGTTTTTTTTTGGATTTTTTGGTAATTGATTATTGGNTTATTGGTTATTGSTTTTTGTTTAGTTGGDSTTTTTTGGATTTTGATTAGTTEGGSTTTTTGGVL